MVMPSSKVTLATAWEYCDASWTAIGQSTSYEWMPNAASLRARASSSVKNEGKWWLICVGDGWLEGRERTRQTQLADATHTLAHYLLYDDLDIQPRVLPLCLPLCLLVCLLAKHRHVTVTSLLPSPNGCQPLWVLQGPRWLCTYSR